MVLKKKLMFAAGLAAAVMAGLGAKSAVADEVVFDSGGFESSAGYMTGETLAGQNGFSQSDNTGSMPAVVSVQPYSDPTASTNAGRGTQFVLVNDQNITSAANTQLNPTDTTVYPTNHIPPGGPPFVPSAASGTNIVNVDFALNVQAPSAGNPFFGILVFGDSTAGSYPTNNIIAELGVSPAVGSTSAAVVTEAGQVGAATATVNTFYDYQISLNYTTQMFTVSQAPDGSSAYTPLGTFAFYNPAQDFTDADISSFVENNGPTSTGEAAFDNYNVTAVPLPEAGAAFALCSVGLLVLGRRSGSAVAKF